MTGYKSWIIPEGNVTEVRDSLGRVMWSLPTTPSSCAYVSLGDSIAAGHSLNGWSMDTQYGSEGRQSTEIVPDSYTALIRDNLMTEYKGKVSAISFARSGDRVSHLIAKLDHTLVRTAISNANIVTICIGANDILGEVNDSVMADYIDGGDPTLVALGERVQANLDILADNNNANSYRALFDKLRSINPKAKYVFMTIYNPYKYLHLDEGRNGFFYHILNFLPNNDIGNFIKDGILDTPVIQTLFSRTNALAPWVETYVEKLNSVIRTKISEYNNANFIVADAKAAFDVFPDRPYAATYHYNDLVNVEYTSEYETDDMDWGQLWDYNDSGAAGYWLGLIAKYGLDINGLAAEFVAGMIEKVIVPDLDPHPKSYGQKVLKRAFADVIDLQPLEYYSITYNANGASGSMPVQKVINIDGNAAVTTIRANSFVGATGYYFLGWNTASNGSGTYFSHGQLINLNSNLTLYAQWSNIYTVTVRHYYDNTTIYNVTGSDTGPQECYALWMNGSEQPDLGAFDNSPRTYYVPYGTSIGVIVSNASGDKRSYVTFNGTTVNHHSYNNDSPPGAKYSFNITSNTVIDFEWNLWLSGLNVQSYWNCYITT